jgi:hypothetical protein
MTSAAFPRPKGPNLPPELQLQRAKIEDHAISILATWPPDCQYKQTKSYYLNPWVQGPVGLRQTFWLFDFGYRSISILKTGGRQNLGQKS